MRDKCKTAKFLKHQASPMENDDGVNDNKVDSPPPPQMLTKKIKSNIACKIILQYDQ